MTKLIEKQDNRKWIKRGERVLLGISIALLASVSFAKEPPTRVSQVPITKVIEKENVKIVPVEINNNDKRQIQCLAENAYYEAGNQSLKGKIAVTNVVMNRVRDKRFPKSACAVVYQKTRGKCQFSWVCHSKRRIRNWEAFNTSRKIAEDVYLNNIGDITGGAKFFHADYVRPAWGRSFKRTIRIGNHIFYKG